jgi:hypothetical protein
LLGEERDPAARLNALTVGRSAHLQEELAWRMGALVATAARKPQDPRPFAEHGSADGAFGMHCGLGDPGFKSWTCAAGLKCIDVHGDLVGICSPSGEVGDACVTSQVTLVADSHKDKLTSRQSKQCKGSGVACQDGAGFPDGLCADSCTQAGKTTGKKICGAVPMKDKNVHCLVDERRPFLDCLKESSVPVDLHTCNAKEPCRDDYACMRVDQGSLDTGACMPPYFAFQVRVDGHMFDE